MKPAAGWRSYLPDYGLPRSMRYCFGCLALLLAGGAIFIFLILPGLLAYIASISGS